MRQAADFTPDISEGVKSRKRQQKPAVAHPQRPAKKSAKRPTKKLEKRKPPILVDSEGERVFFKLDGGESAIAARNVENRRIPGKGRGLIAKRNLNAGSFVGCIPGWIFSRAEFAALHRLGLYVDTYATGVADDDGRQYTVCCSPEGSLLPHVMFRKCYGQYINEPDDMQKHTNVSWVLNHHKQIQGIPRVDMYTNTAVKQGTELVVDYGYGYQRSYRRPPMRPKKKALRTWHIKTLDRGRPGWVENEEWDGSQMSDLEDEDNRVRSVPLAFQLRQMRRLSELEEEERRERAIREAPRRQRTPPKRRPIQRPAVDRSDWPAWPPGKFQFYIGTDDPTNPGVIYQGPPS